MIMSKSQPIINLPGEIWAPAFLDLTELPGYYVSTYGRVKSTLTSFKIGNKFSGTSFDGAEKLMKPVVEKNADGSPKSQRINLSISSDLFEYSYANSSKCSSRRVRRKVHVHRLVMDTFRPIFDHPPERLKPFWDELPHEVKLYIYESISVDHKDHNPTNNKLENLHYVTPRENMRNAIRFYDGNYSNKKTYSSDTSSSDTPEQLNTPTVSLLSFAS